VNKGQIFSMDALLSILGVTIILGLVTTQFSILYDQYQENVFEKLDSIASDMANIGTSNYMAHPFPDGIKKPGVIDSGKLTEFRTFLEQTYGKDYSGKVELLGSRELINDGCSKQKNYAIEQRLVMDFGSKQVGWLRIGVCYSEE